MQREIRRFLALGLAVAMLGAAAILPVQPAKQVAAAGLTGGSYQVYLASLAFDPANGLPQVNQSLDMQKYQAGQQGLYLVQFNGPVYDSYKSAVTAAGAKLGDYIPQSAFVAQMTPEVATNVASMSFVRNVSVYKPAYKLENTLVNAQGQVISEYAGTQSPVLTMVAFNPAAASQLASYLKAQGDDVLAVQGQFVTVRLNLGRLAGVAQNPNVVAVQPESTFHIFNERAAGVLNDTVAWNSGLHGEGQIVATADTGLDTGKNDSSMHPDFQGQIKSIYSLGRQGDASDTNGHGTHTAGSIVGSGAASGGQNKGMAYKAKLVFQSVLDSQGGLGGLPGDLNTLFGQAYQAGARIHSDSWGSDASGAYDDASSQVDQFIWNHPDMSILIAAGNSGQNSSTKQTQYNSIASPGTAKNAITVGASDNNRPEQGQYGTDINAIAPFSSRGYAADGRVKPDIVAPGTWVLSTKSSLAPDSNYWKVQDSHYAYDGGTSMATPLTAGTVALMRQWYGQQGVNDPSAALLKASLINGAQDVGLGLPSRDQGWGRVDLRNSIMPTGSRTMKFEDSAHSLSTGDSQSYSVSVSDGSVPLKATLVWSDYPGSTSAGQALVNDLDLTVTSPTGKAYNGNDFTSPYNDRVDHLNNVEQVIINNPEQGTYTFSVKGGNVPQGPQPYALVYSGTVGSANPNPNPPPNPNPNPGPTVSITAPQSGATVKGTVSVNANATGASQVAFSVDGNKVATVTSAPYTYSWDTTQVANGQHTLQAVASDSSGKTVNSDVVTVNVSNPTPPTPSPKTKTSVFNDYADANYWYYTWRGHTINVTAPGRVDVNLSWQGRNTDLDLYVVDPNGNVVAQAADLKNPEVTSFQAKATGQYTLVINAYSGGAAYRVTASYPVAAGR
ncbi:MAG: S8 family serine peptidase [Symbiobacteriia bacterium]